MELTVNKAGRYACIWLTRADKTDSLVMEQMQHFIDEFKLKKYRVAIFESGEQDLVEKTKELLVHNKGIENKCAE
ncbi:MAG: hypothetical protein ACI4HQ_09400 [Acetatifactor sp.]